jgi:hypothetical protein
MAAKQNPYALKVLGAAIECDIVGKGILELFNTCLQMNGQTQQTSQNPLTVLTETQPMNFDHLP